MQIINLNKEGKNSPIMIFRNEKEGRVFFSTTVSHKDIDGNYQNAFINVQFVDIVHQKEVNVSVKIHRQAELFAEYVAESDIIKSS